MGGWVVQIFRPVNWHGPLGGIRSILGRARHIIIQLIIKAEFLEVCQLTTEFRLIPSSSPLRPGTLRCLHQEIPCDPWHLGNIPWIPHLAYLKVLKHYACQNQLISCGVADKGIKRATYSNREGSRFLCGLLLGISPNFQEICFITDITMLVPVNCISTVS